MMRELGSIDISDEKRLTLKIGEYQGSSERIDLRLYVKKDKDFIATRSGVSCPGEYLDSFIKLINKLDNV